MTLSQEHPGEMLPVRVIRLTRGKIALVDPEDYENANSHRWRAIPHAALWHAARTIRRPDGTRTTQYLHSYLTGWRYTDHQNRDGLDNRRSNLRESTHAQNMANRVGQVNNTSGHPGVRWERGGWVVKAGSHPSRYVGRYADFGEAVAARHEAMKEKYGEFAPNCCD